MTQRGTVLRQPDVSKANDRCQRRRSRWLVLCAIQVLTLTAQSGGALSQEAYPTRSIKLVVPYVAGGGTDTSARIFAQFMSARLGQQIVVENVGGAGGVVGTNNVARAQPDGYTVLYTSQAPLTVQPFLKQKPPYDAEKDIRPLAIIVNAPTLLLASPTAPGKDLKEFIEAARRDPGKYRFGSPGVGNDYHLLFELLKAQAQIGITHIPYRGTAPAMTGLLTDQIHVLLTSVGQGMPQVQDGKARVLAVIAQKRLPELPDIPTIAEAGFPKANMVPWFGLFAPAQVPQGIVAAWDRHTRDLQNSPEWREKMQALKFEPELRTLSEFNTVIDDARALWKVLIPSLQLDGGN
jgi:tripartite-type tricarboxylate transporter receptor subunit TctC